MFPRCYQHFKITYLHEIARQKERTNFQVDVDDPTTSPNLKKLVFEEPLFVILTVQFLHKL